MPGKLKSAPSPVNGQFVKRDNKATNVMAGVPIRIPVEDKARFVPVSKEKWLEAFSLGIDYGSAAPQK